MAPRPKTKRKRVVPMKSGKPVSKRRARKELNPKMKPGAAHAEKRQEMMLKKKKKIRRTG